jgi:branched-chain amino acid transport system substrate-binding protein
MKKLALIGLALLVVASLMGLMAVGCGGGTTTTTAGPTTTAGATTTSVAASTTTAGGGATTTSAAAGGGTIKIGALLDFTGAVAELGPLFEMGIKTALEEVNYTVAGKKIELIVEDSATSVDMAVTKAKKLVEQDGVKIIIGPLMGDAHLALGPYTAEKGVLITSLINGMWETVGKGNYLVYPTTVDAQTYPFGQYCFQKLGYKTAVVLAADYAGKRGYAAGWIQGFKDAGGTVIQEIYPPVGTPDYSPFISTIKDSELVMYAFEGPGAVSKFIYQYNQAGKKAPLVTITQADDYSPPMLNELKDIIVGIKGESTYTWKLDNPENKKFVEAIKAKWNGLPPMPEQQNSYALTKAILAGLEKTGGDDTLAKLFPAITSTQINTPAGLLKWDPSGVAICPMYVTTAEKVGSNYEISAPLDTVPEVLDKRLAK